MRLLAYSDLQATTGHERCFHNPALPLQQWRVRKFYERLSEIYVERRCDGLVDLGDTTDDRNAIPLPTIDDIFKGLDRFPKTDCNIKIVGNHEQFHKSTLVHTGKLYASKFRVIENREIFHLGGTKIIAVSYPENDHELATWLKDIISRRKAGEKIILFGHFQLTGCVMKSGISLIGVPTSILEPITLGLLGHVHRGQAVLPHIHYLGSPFQQNFGESSEPKRVAIVDTNRCSIEWVEIKGFPEYRTTDLKGFLDLDPNSEDRVSVCIRSPQEAEKFYAHPLVSRVVEPIYQYDLSEEAVTKAHTQAYTPRDTLSRYVHQNPPSVQDIVIGTDDMVELGLQIAGVTE